MTTAASGAKTTKAPKPASWYGKLWVQVLIAMAVGIVLGHFFPAFGVRMQPLGDTFIKAIRVLIAPIIFCTVVHGIARMADLARVGRVALKTLIYFEVVTTLALIIGLAAVNIWRPGVGMNVNLATVDTSAVKTFVTQTQNQGVVSFLMNMIPSTFIGAFAEGNVLQVLLLAVVCGFALTWLRDAGKPVLDLIDVISRMLFQIVKIVMWTAPLGAFGAIAFTVGKFGAVSLLSLGKLILGFYVTCLIFIGIVLWPIARFCGFSLFKLLRYIREELLICIATTSSETVLPRMLVKLEDLGCDGAVVGLVIPTGYSFNLDGTCLYLSCTVVFLAQATNTHLSLTQQIGLLAVLLLTSKGAAGIAGAAFVVLAATLASTGTIPVASVALVLGIHRLLSQGMTPTNLVGNAVATIAMAKWEGALDEEQLHRALDGGPAKASSSE
jgi:aerobic C4-dicarboxylate transport protein